MMIWGSSFVVLKSLLESNPPVVLLFQRLAVSTVFLFLVILISKRSMKIEKQDRHLVFMAAFFEPFLYFVGESFGLRLISASLAAVLIATIPLFNPIFTWLLLKEKVSLREIVSLIVSFGGILMIVTSNFEGGATIKGIAFMSLAIFSAVGYSIVTKQLVTKYSSITLVAYQNSISTLLFLPVMLIFHWGHPIFTGYTIYQTFSLLGLGIMASGVAYIFLAISIRDLGINMTGLISNLIPVFTGLISYFFFDEVFTIQKVIGMGVVIFGLFFSQLKFKMEWFRSRIG